MAHSTDQKQYPPPPMGAPPPMLGVPMQGLPPQAQPQASLQWTTGLCGCTEDVGNCFMTFCCPCVTFGKIAEIVDRGSSSCGASGAMYALIGVLTGCQCIYSCTYRSKMRALYGLPETPCPDFLLHCCCEACALCQEYRELKNRGFDMDIGWHANMERQQGQQMMMTQPPAMQPGMHRST